MTTTTSAATLEHTIGQTGRFVLRVRSGEVRVRAVDGDVARVRDLDGRSLADRFEIETREGLLSLRARDSGGLNFVIDLGFLNRGSHANLEIDVPRRATVEFETASADIEADGLQGSTHVRTASGELMLTAAGGSIDIEAVSGDVHVSGDLPMSVGCRTVSGEVAVEAPSLNRFQVTTTSGDVRAVGVLTGEGPFSVNTVSGDAEIVTSSGLRVEAKTVSGDISTPEQRRADGGPGQRIFSIGNGQTPFSFRSISGDLTIWADRASAPAAPVAPVAPVAPAAPVAPVAPEAPAVADARLEVLRALERGEISVEDATLKLAELDGEGER